MKSSWLHRSEGSGPGELGDPARTTGEYSLFVAEFSTVTLRQALSYNPAQVMPMTSEENVNRAEGGLDLEKYKPRVIVIENLFRDKKYKAYMRAKGYRLWRCLRPNDIYTNEEVGFGERYGYSTFQGVFRRWNG